MTRAPRLATEGWPVLVALLGARRLCFCLAALAGGLVVLLFARPDAGADSDLFSNVGPESQVPEGGIAERYPLSRYALDQHFEAVEASLTGGIDVSGVPALIAYFLANLLWELTAFVANAVITLFTFAFSLDLVQGSVATGGAGALAPVSDAVRTIYREVFGAAWLVVAITLAGMWAMWRALVQRRYTQTAGALGLSLVFVVIALAFVTQPQSTIGTASDWTNRMSAAFLSLTAEGDIASEDQAKRAASDQLFALLVYDPWAVLNFGGIEHCVRTGTGDEDSDPESVPVRPLSQDPARDRELRAQLRSGTQVSADGKTCINNKNKYAPHFLAFAPGSEERDKEYQALNEADAGKLPDANPAAEGGGYELSAADKPATDAMEEGGQYQRLLMAVVIFVAELGAFLLLGALSVGVILAQVLVLLLLAFAPVALVVGVFPGRGHDFFRGWLIRLGAFLLKKAIYSLILAVLLAVAAALADASAYLGWFLAFALQALFFWAVFLYRNELTGMLTAATAGAPGHEGQDAGQRLRSLYYASRLTKLGRRSHGGHTLLPPSNGGGEPSAPAPPPAPPTNDGPPPTSPQALSEPAVDKEPADAGDTGGDRRGGDRGDEPTSHDDATATAASEQHGHAHAAGGAEHYAPSSPVHESAIHGEREPAPEGRDRSAADDPDEARRPTPAPRPGRGSEHHDAPRAPGADARGANEASTDATPKDAQSPVSDSLREDRRRLHGEPPAQHGGEGERS